MGDEHFALLFATNTFGALAVFAVLQAIISSLGLDIFERFWVYTVCTRQGHPHTRPPRARS
jgi:hypothetical protein